MPNKIVFNIGGETREADRKFLEEWYKEENPYDYDYDLMKHELERTTIKDLAELYIGSELSEDGLSVSYELLQDPIDIDIAESLMFEIRYLCEELRWMLPEKERLKFLENLMRKNKVR